MDRKPTYEDLEARIKELEDQLASLTGDHKEKPTEKALLNNYQFTLNHIRNNIFRLAKTPQGKIIYLLNEGPIPSQFGVTTNVVYGKTIVEIVGEEGGREAEEYYERAFAGEVVQYRANFADVWFETVLSPVEVDGKVVEVAGSSYDITERIKAQQEIQRLNEELQRLSETDKLTGLYNRYKVDAVLQYEINRSERYENRLAVILMDLDHFKEINDTYGHLVGDKVLVEVAELLQTNLRNVDRVGRWGGEEFLIICPQTTLEEACALAERIRTALEEHKLKTAGKITASFGVSRYCDHDRPEVIVGRADKAMYQAKQAGRNQLAVQLENC